MNSSEPLITIVLINYNGFSDTVECIKSLQNIIYLNYKIVVVDNLSTQKPTTEDIEYIKSHSLYIESNKNLGFSGGNNLGMIIGKDFNPEYYLLLNNDTIVEPNFLNELITETKKYNNIGISIGRINYFTERNKPWYCGGYFDFKNGIAHHFTEEENGTCSIPQFITFATGCLMLIPAPLIASLNYMSEDYFLYCEDTDLSVRILNKGYKILYCPQSIIYHKVSATTGKKSAINQFYYVRNTMIIIKRFAKHKYRGYLKMLFNRLKDVIRGRLNYQYTLLALSDFFRGRVGLKSNLPQ